MSPHEPYHLCLATTHHLDMYIYIIYIYLRWFHRNARPTFQQHAIQNYLAAHNRAKSFCNDSRFCKAISFDSPKDFLTSLHLVSLEDSLRKTGRMLFLFPTKGITAQKYSGGYISSQYLIHQNTPFPPPLVCRTL